MESIKALADWFKGPDDINTICQNAINDLTKNPQNALTIIKPLFTKYSKVPGHFKIIIESLLLGNLSLKDALANLSNLKIPNSVCGRAISPNEFLWVCETCTAKKVESCVPVFCSTCFIQEKHKGHTFTYQLGSENATCDCGDEGWLKTDSFCPLHKKKLDPTELENFLPPYNKNVTPQVIRAFQNIIHEWLVSDDPDTLLQILVVYGNLRKLIGISQAFANMISKSFLENYTDHQTTHICEADTCEKSKEKIDLHTCQCNVLEAVSKKLLRLARDKDFSDLMTELVRVDEKFGDPLFGSFWKNYCYLFDIRDCGEEERTQMLYKILWQCCIEGKVLHKYLPLYSKYYVSCLRYTIQRINALDLNEIARLTYFLMYDFHTFMNADYYMGPYFVNDQDFFKGYLNSLMELEFTNNIQVRATHVEDYIAGLIREIPLALEYFMRIFAFILRSYDMKNADLNTKIFNFFREKLEKLITDFPDIEKLNSFNIPFLRCFSYFINKYIYMNFDPNAYASSDLYYISIKNDLMKLFGFTDKSAFEKFVYEILKRAFRIQNFIAEGESNLWIYYGQVIQLSIEFMAGMYRTAFLAPDIALIQNLMTLLPENSINIEEFLEMNENEKLEEKAQKDAKKLKMLRDRKFIELISIIFNTDCRLACYIMTLKEDFYKLDFPRSEQAIKKECLRVLMQNEDRHMHYEHIDTSEILKVYPPYLRHKDGQKTLSEFLIKKPNFEYSISPETLKYFDYCSFMTQRGTTNSEFNMTEIVKRLKLSNFNLLQIPPRLKEDIYNIQGIFRNIDKMKLCEVYQKSREKLKISETPEIIEKTKDFEIIDTMFLKIVYEAIVNNLFADSTISAKFIDLLKQTKIESPLVKPALFQLLEKIKAPLEEQKAEPITDKKELSPQAKLKEQQQKIRNEYLEKMKLFASKHAEELVIMNEQKEQKESSVEPILDEICCICKDKLNSKKAYGRVCAVVGNGHLKRILRENSMKCEFKEEITKEILKSKFYSGSESSIKSCGHYGHLECLGTYEDNFCPVCKMPMTCAVPCITNCEDIEKGIEFMAPLLTTVAADKNYVEPAIMDDKMLSNIAFSHIWTSCVIGTVTSISEIMIKRHEDLQQVIKYLQYLIEKNKITITDIINSELFELSFIAPHLTEILLYFLQEKPSDEKLTEFILLKLSNIISWVLFDQKDPELKTTEISIFNKDISHILIQTVILQSILQKWSKEKITQFITICDSEDLQGKIDGLQTLAFGKNSYVKEWILTYKTKNELLINSQAYKTQDIIKILENPSLDKKLYTKIWGLIVGTKSIKLSLFQTLPEVFTEFQLAYFSKNCKRCNKQIRDKLLCLTCGEIICGSKACCPDELIHHTQNCNCGIGVFVHIYYGDIRLIVDKFQYAYGESLYKSLSNRDVTAYTINARVIGSKDLQDYKLNKETFQKWNNEYLTDRLSFKIKDNQFPHFLTY